MMGSLLILFAISPISSPGSAGLSDAAILAIAEQSFAEGTALRNDSAKARPAFARSAIGYDELWQRGYRNPDLTLNRAHTHRLAGDLPGAIAALHQGLAAARWSRPLQVALEDARSAVGYPLVGDLASQCRPTSSPTIGNRMSPVEAWSIAALLWLLACGGMARFVMTRAGWWLMFAGLAMAVLVLLGGVWLQDYRQRQREAADPLLIVADDVFLSKGNWNSETYMPRLEPKLPRGVEVRALSHRGGWVQVQLASGIIGWLPESAVKSALTPQPPLPAGEGE
ncbi:MAG TPA: hypothetical protein VG122_02265 [Gemmata sp.]|jgi:hypothetical protein|nr:hypothetical protein [Gemmata sp.]